MIYVGIDVSKDKHDCYIVNSDGEIVRDVFTFANNTEGFELLHAAICAATPDLCNVKVGLEATGHYSYNLLGFLLNKCLTTYVMNPLHTNLFRKSTSLRRTKTDRVDARTIAAMMMSGVVLESYTAIYQTEQLRKQTDQEIQGADRPGREYGILRAWRLLPVQERADSGQRRYSDRAQQGRNDQRSHPIQM